MRDPRRPVATRLEIFMDGASPIVLINLLLAGYLLSGATQRVPVLVSLGVCVVGTITFIASYIFSRVRGRAQVEDKQFRICPRCRYNLSGLPDPGSCPECGRPFSDDELSELWSKVYRIRDAFDTPSPRSRTRPGDSTPRPARFATRLESTWAWFQFAVVVPLALAIVGVMIFAPTRRLSPLILVLIGANVMQVATSLYLPKVGRRVVRKHDFKLCVRCRYLLTGLADEGACPECGTAYTQSSLREHWSAVYRMSG
jgi:RNA polymerase subunit RPABC4/transcription elongation factor Spt4